MPKDRVCATDTVLPGVSRRSLLAAPMVLLPSNTLARPESQIMRLFRQHERLRGLHEIAWKAGDEAAEDRLYDRMEIIEEKIMAIPSAGAADFAAKVILDTARGSLFSDWETGEVWIEARKLTGCRLH